MLALLRRQIQAEIDMHGGGIADGERAQRLNALRGELRRAEIAEEELIEAAEDRGIVIDRRADAAPRIYLGLWRLDEPQAA